MGEVKKNAAGTLDDQQRDDSYQLQIAVNSIQQTAFIERLPDPMKMSIVRDVFYYDRDNLYPNKIKSMAKRSQTCTTAIETESKFVIGQGFSDENLNDLVINREGQTLGDMLSHASNERSTFKGFALHFNYNIFGEIIEAQEIAFETLRWHKDLDKLVYRRDWSCRISQVNNPQITYHLFNPDKAVEQMNESGGVDEYNGQVLYFIPKKQELYTTCRFDHALDDVQFEHESGLYKLRNIQNDYSSGYVFKYPKRIENELEKDNVKREQGKLRGSNNAGKSVTIPVNPSEMQAMGNMKLIEEIPRTGIDKMFTKQNEDTRFNIYAAFQQPPILNGISKDGMFNQESFLDAFDFYNSVTESGRKELERVFSKFLEVSIWGIDKVEILPLDFQSRREKVVEQDNSNKTQENGAKSNTEED
jgi:hypothetical protein